MHTFPSAEQRSNESLGASSIYNAYQMTDRKGMGDSSKYTTGSTSTSSAPTRRSSVTSIKSFTAMLPSVLETVESETCSSDSTSAMNMNVESSSEVKSEDVNATMNEKIVQIAEMAISESSSITSENKRKDKSMEITSETDNTEHAEKNSSSKVDSMPDIQIYKCTDVNMLTHDRYKRRMSKSCDQLDVDIKPNTTGKWKSWSNFLSTISNTVTRVKHGLSSSINHVDQLVDDQDEKLPEENQN